MLPESQEIGCKALASLLASNSPPRLIDCREIHEFELCKIDSAELIPLSLFPQNYANTLQNKAEKIIIYCHHGVRSLYATNFLLEQGFEHVFSLAGGIDQWSTTVDPNTVRY